MGKSWGNKGLKWGVEESEEITNQPLVTGKSGAQARPAAGVGWGGVGKLELKSREESEIFMTYLCVFTASAGGAALGRVTGRKESWMQSRGEWGTMEPANTSGLTLVTSPRC